MMCLKPASLEWTHASPQRGQIMSRLLFDGSAHQISLIDDARGSSHIVLLNVTIMPRAGC